MKIVVIGGTGLMGSKLVSKPGGQGHDAVAAAPNSASTALRAMTRRCARGAAAVVDVTNSPSCRRTQPCCDASRHRPVTLVGAAAGLKIMLIWVVERNNCWRAASSRRKLAEDMIGLPSALHDHARHAFLRGDRRLLPAGQSGTPPPVLIPPTAGERSSRALAGIATSSPVNRTIEVEGPEKKFRWITCQAGPGAFYEGPTEVRRRPQRKHHEAGQIHRVFNQE